MVSTGQKYQLFANKHFTNRPIAQLNFRFIKIMPSKLERCFFQLHIWIFGYRKNYCCTASEEKFNFQLLFAYKRFTCITRSNNLKKLSVDRSGWLQKGELEQARRQLQDEKYQALETLKTRLIQVPIIKTKPVVGSINSAEPYFSNSFLTTKIDMWSEKVTSVIIYVSPRCSVTLVIFAGNYTWLFVWQLMRFVVKCISDNYMFKDTMSDSQINFTLWYLACFCCSIWHLCLEL